MADSRSVRSSNDRRTNSITRRLRADYVARVHFRGGTRFNRDYDFSRALINSTVVPDRAGEGKRRVEERRGDQGRACDHHSEFIMADTILSVIHAIFRVEEEEEEDLEAMKFLA